MRAVCSGVRNEPVIRAEHVDFAVMIVAGGFIDYDAAVRSGGITFDRSPALAREFPRWLMWSPMARHVAPSGTV